jgi:hypothetical protein
MFLLHIGKWLAFRESAQRKSMPMRSFETMGVEVPTEHGLYLLDADRLEEAWT